MVALEKGELYSIGLCRSLSSNEAPPPPELESLHFYDRWPVYEEYRAAK